MTEQGYRGTETPESTQGDYNATAFLVRMILGEASTATLVRVVAVSNQGGVTPVGFVDVQPLVHQVAGDNSPVPHAVIYGLPYFRLQGGANAVILDPQVGDIGMAAFADHDLTSVKATKAAALPGSDRRFDRADGMYFGGLLNGTPTQYVRFHEGGIALKSAGAVTIDAASSVTVNAQKIDLNAPVIGLNGALVQTKGSAGTATVQLVGPVNVQNDVVAGAISLQSHTHGGVQAGGSNTGVPK